MPTFGVRYGGGNFMQMSKEKPKTGRSGGTATTSPGPRLGPTHRCRVSMEPPGGQTFTIFCNNFQVLKHSGHHAKKASGSIRT